MNGGKHNPFALLVALAALLACPSLFAEVDNLSRDQKAFEAERQQRDAKNMQDQQAEMKNMQKQQKEAERASTTDPGRQAQLTQEINKLQDEISKHQQQSQALQDTLDKANYAGKQSEAGNATKGNQQKGSLDRNGVQGAQTAGGSGRRSAPGRVPTLTEAAGITTTGSGPRSAGSGPAALESYPDGSDPSGNGDAPTETLTSDELHTEPVPAGKRSLVEKTLKAFDAQFSSLPTPAGGSQSGRSPASLSSATEFNSVQFAAIDPELEQRTKEARKRLELAAASPGGGAGGGGGGSGFHGGGGGGSIAPIGAASGKDGSLLDSLRAASPEWSGKNGSSDESGSAESGATVLSDEKDGQTAKLSHGIIGGSTRARHFRIGARIARATPATVGVVAAGFSPPR